MRRVFIGFGLVNAVTLVLGLCSAWLLGEEAPAPLREQYGIAIVTAITLGGSLLALVSSMLIVSSVRHSVESTVGCVTCIADGDLHSKIDSPGKDEISWLRAELNKMRKNLRDSLVQVNGAIVDVNNAAAKNANGNSDLSQRTETQVGALQQTVSSMDQLADAVRSNAHSTQEARTLVALSNTIAGRGAQTMSEVVTRMVEINGSSNRVSEIVGVIEGIAFQTNILALNAAVEAARAEQLIGDIAEAGLAQSDGIGQIRQTIAHIDESTHQNAALVEELTTSARSLKSQSDRVQGAISAFRVAA